MKTAAAFLLSLALILSLTVNALAADIDQTPSGIPFAGLESYIDGYMSQYIGKTSPGAAVAIVSEGRILFSKGYGYADIDKKSPVDSAQTVFEYGSISKLFVYTAVMRLAEEGKIDLKADVRQYLSEGFLKKLRYDEPITLLDIMNHAAGFEDYLFDVILTTSKNRPSLEETLMNCQPEQVYRPGTVSAYSNYVVALAAYIVERITGQKYYEYITENILNPVHMSQTSAHPLLMDKPEILKTKANGYYSTGSGFKPGGWSYVPMYPIGGINGTAEDLARFAIALMPEGTEKCALFNKRETLDEMLTQTRPMGPGVTGFAHGFIEWDGEYRGLGHGGNTAFFSTQINIVPEKRFGIIVLTNSANEMDITSGLTEALMGKISSHMPVSGSSLPDAKEVEGDYIMARRMHNGFLELYGYMAILNVKALEPNKIEFNLGGQSSILVQTRPHVFERISATGPLLKYNFGTVYFDVENGKVKRISGDFLPLPVGRTVPFLIAGLAVIILTALYIGLSILVLLFRKLFKKENSLVRTSLNKRVSRINLFILLCGLAILANNVLMVMRMLINNYRSFPEVKIHILLNYPLAAIIAVLLGFVILNWRGAMLLKSQKVFYLSTAVIITAFVATLIYWQFFNVIS